ncbi:MAG: hypothetical protein ACU83U_11580 [Gammaproteobacteria bacterium]
MFSFSYRKIAFLIIAISSAVNVSADNDKIYKSKSIELKLTNSTQGPLWPPSEYADKDGDFVLVGNVLKQMPNNQIGMEWDAVIVSKDTVPPLNSAGEEDFSNFFGSTYTVVRKLDLSPNSPDLNMELYSLSFGPYSGNFGGGPRIPKLGNSTYNLNGSEPSCPEIFPASKFQAEHYTRDSFPIELNPVMGFQGDNIAYNAATGAVEDPFYASGPDCGKGCSGENPVTTRDTTTPYTLGEHLLADGEVKITLTNWNPTGKAYTAAHFDFKFEKLRPNKVYSVWSIQQVVITPPPLIRRPAPFSTPNVFVTDNEGNATVSFDANNPFPDPATDVNGLRLVGIAIDYHSDDTIWGACPDRIGPGISIHNVFNQMFMGTAAANLITTAAP